MDLFKNHIEKRWITVYFNFKLKKKSKRFMKKFEEFIKETKWEVYSDKIRTDLKSMKENKEIHIGPNNRAIISPKKLIPIHYKLGQFSQQISKYLREEKPEFKTELSIVKKKVTVIHLYGNLCFIYDLKDRIEFEEYPNYYGLSNKMFVTPVEDIKKKIVKSHML